MFFVRQIRPTERRGGGRDLFFQRVPQEEPKGMRSKNSLDCKKRGGGGRGKLILSKWRGRGWEASRLIRVKPHTLVVRGKGKKEKGKEEGNPASRREKGKGTKLILSVRGNDGKGYRTALP